MKTLLQVVFASMLLGSAAFAEDAMRELTASMKDQCFRCHGGEKTKGKVDLVALHDGEDMEVGDRLDLLETIIEVLENGEMPPEDEPQPTEKQRDAWIATAESVLDEALAGKGDPTGVPMRRFNRLEYNNAVVQLFDLDLHPFALMERTARDHNRYFQPASGKMPDSLKVGNRALGKSQFLGKGNTLRGVAAFPKDNRAEWGFDNRADHLTLSPLLMEQFLKLSQSIVDSKDLNPRECGSWERGRASAAACASG